MVPIGVDVHKRRCKVAEFKVEDGKVKVWTPIENTREDWLELLPELPPDAEIALEVSTAGYFAMTVLDEAGWGKRAHWVHTAGIDSPRKQKYDRLDAERLSRMRDGGAPLGPAAGGLVPAAGDPGVASAGAAALLVGGTAGPG